MKHHRMGFCPCCKARIHEYGVLGLSKGSVYFPWRCRCGALGREYSELKFIEHIIEKESSHVATVRTQLRNS